MTEWSVNMSFSNGWCSGENMSLQNAPTGQAFWLLPVQVRNFCTCLFRDEWMHEFLKLHFNFSSFRICGKITRSAYFWTIIRIKSPFKWGQFFQVIFSCTAMSVWLVIFLSVYLFLVMACWVLKNQVVSFGFWCGFLQGMKYWPTHKRQIQIPGQILWCIGPFIMKIQCDFISEYPYSLFLSITMLRNSFQNNFSTTVKDRPIKLLFESVLAKQICYGIQVKSTTSVDIYNDLKKTSL